VGTAVRVPGAPTSEPFTSSLDGQEFWKLHRAGYLPREIAFGVCSYYLHGDQQTRALLSNFWGQGLANQEVTQFSEGFRLARHLASERFSREVARSQAHGAVGVEVTWELEDIEYEQNDRTYHDLLVNFCALGTAITARPEPVSPVPTLTFLNLKE